MNNQTNWNNNHWVLGLAVAFMLVVIVILYPNLPDVIPVHFNWQGDADGWLPKAVAIWIMPALTILLWGITSYLPHIDPKKERYEEFAASYKRIRTSTAVLLSALHVMLLTSYDEPQLITRMVLFSAAIFFAVIGNEMGRFEQTWFSGIRTPWTLADERVWRRTHRVGARWFVGVGLLNALLVPFLPIPVALAVFLISVVGVSIGTTGYSYMLYKRLNS